MRVQGQYQYASMPMGVNVHVGGYDMYKESKVKGGANNVYPH